MRRETSPQFFQNRMPRMLSRTLFMVAPLCLAAGSI
jgi:hypothetical protein